MLVKKYFCIPYTGFVLDFETLKEYRLLLDDDKNEVIVIVYLNKDMQNDIEEIVLNKKINGRHLIKKITNDLNRYWRHLLKNRSK